MTKWQAAQWAEMQAAKNAIGQTRDMFFSGHDVFVHDHPGLADMAPFDDDLSNENGNRWHADSYESEPGFFWPDEHPWYLSLEHALEWERDNPTIVAHVLQHAADVPSDAPMRVLVTKTFAQTYVWPVFRALAHIGL